MNKEFKKLEQTIIGIMDMMDLDTISCLGVLADVASAYCKASENHFPKEVKPSDLFIQFFNENMKIK
jgi:hypothetical protein